MALSAANIKTRLDNAISARKAIADPADLAKFTSPFAAELFDIISTMISIAPPPIPPSTLTPGGVCPPVVKLEASIRSDLKSRIQGSLTVTDTSALDKFVNPMATALYAIFASQLIITCPPGGGAAVFTLSESTIESTIRSGLSASLGVTNAAALAEFTEPAATAIYQTVMTETTLTFPPVGGQGVFT